MAKPTDAKVTTTVPTTPPEPTVVTKQWGVSAREFYASLRDKPVRVTTLDGKVYTATLVGVDRNDLALKLGDGSLVLIAKHAIKLVAPGNGKTEPAGESA